MPRLKDVRNSLLIAHNNSLPSDEELLLLLLLDENLSENPQFNYEKYERFYIDDTSFIIDIALTILSTTHVFLKQK